MNGRAHGAIQSIRCRGLDTQLIKPLVSQRLERRQVMIMAHEGLLREPQHQRLDIRHTRRMEPQALANHPALALRRSARPRLRVKDIRRDCQLLGDIRLDSGRDFVGMIRETTLILKNLEHHRQTKPIMRSCTSDPTMLLVCQSECRDQFRWGPFPFHDPLTSILDRDGFHRGCPVRRTGQAIAACRF